MGASPSLSIDICHAIAAVTGRAVVAPVEGGSDAKRHGRPSVVD